MRTCEAKNKTIDSQLVREYINIHSRLLAVICPHTAEEVYRKLLKNEKSIFEDPLDQDDLDKL